MVGERSSGQAWSGYGGAGQVGAAGRTTARATVWQVSPAQAAGVLIFDWVVPRGYRWLLRSYGGAIAGGAVEVVHLSVIRGGVQCVIDTIFNPTEGVAICPINASRMLPQPFVVEQGDIVEVTMEQLAGGEQGVFYLAYEEMQAEG